MVGKETLLLSIVTQIQVVAANWLHNTGVGIFAACDHGGYTEFVSWPPITANTKKFVL